MRYTIQETNPDTYTQESVLNTFSNDCFLLTFIIIFCVLLVEFFDRRRRKQQDKILEQKLTDAINTAVLTSLNNTTSLMEEHYTAYLEGRTSPDKDTTTVYPPGDFAGNIIDKELLADGSVVGKVHKGWNISGKADHTPLFDSMVISVDGVIDTSPFNAPYPPVTKPAVEESPLCGSSSDTESSASATLPATEISDGIPRFDGKKGSPLAQQNFLLKNLPVIERLLMEGKSSSYMMRSFNVNWIPLAEVLVVNKLPTPRDIKAWLRSNKQSTMTLKELYLLGEEAGWRSPFRYAHANPGKKLEYISVVSMLKNGMTVAQIAKKVGYSTFTVYAFLKKNGIPTPRADRKNKCK